MTTSFDPRLIAFYLPQYHPIPENDRWWGRGFTEWTNVTRARPQYAGHVQPRLPADLGFYDLRLPETRAAQAALARQAGIHGFCYYHYWFGGKRLLQRPFDEMVAMGQPDFPFCVCWANENWTRSWDGLEREILMEQRYADVEPESFVRDLLPALRDPRYIRIDGKPLVLVYRPERIPDAARWVERWRRFARAEGVGDLYLCRVHAFTTEDPAVLGFDAAVEFPPLGGLLERSVLGGERQADLLALGPGFTGRVAEYSSLVRAALTETLPPYRRFRGVIPGWDNTARRGAKATIFNGSSPQAYEQWLTATVRQCLHDQAGEERLVFINAWNEWAEGCILEPDLQWGDAYIRATRSALDTAVRLHGPAFAEAARGDPRPLIELLESRERSIVALAAEVQSRDRVITNLRRALIEAAPHAGPASAANDGGARGGKSLQAAPKSRGKAAALIFGAGKGGERAYDHLRSEWKIAAFVDNDPAKQGSSLCGRPVISPAQIADYGEVAVFVASMYGDQIHAQLLAAGIPRLRIHHLDAQILAGVRPVDRRQLEVILFGTGRGAERALAHLPVECRVIGFADNDPARVGTEFHGLPVFAPSEIAKREFDHVIVASMYANEIVVQLEQLGLARHRIEVVHPDILAGVKPAARSKRTRDR